MNRKKSTTQVVKEIKRATRRRYSAEEKIRIVLEGLRGEESIAELCRKEQLNPNVYYRWSKEFLEAGKSRLNGNTLREAGSDERLLVFTAQYMDNPSGAFTHLFCSYVSTEDWDDYYPVIRAMLDKWVAHDYAPLGATLPETMID